MSDGRDSDLSAGSEGREGHVVERETVWAEERILLPSHDGHVLHVARYPGSADHALLVLPDGILRDCERLRALLKLRQDAPSVYVLDPRGSGFSEGSWSKESHAQDILHLVAKLKSRYPRVTALAEGHSASVLLMHDPADAMVLVEPKTEEPMTEKTKTEEPGTEQRNGACRIQAATVLLTREPARFASLRGCVSARRLPAESLTAKWESLLQALDHVRRHDVPIRFSTLL
jgi:pimeloyl-ACP methyl ester carboxylesterase